MANPFVQSMASNFEEALRLMEAALTDCPDDLWETDLWPDEAPTGPTLSTRNAHNLGYFDPPGARLASWAANIAAL